MRNVECTCEVARPGEEGADVEEVISETFPACDEQNDEHVDQQPRRDVGGTLRPMFIVATQILFPGWVVVVVVLVLLHFGPTITPLGKQIRRLVFTRRVYKYFRENNIK